MHFRAAHISALIGPFVPGQVAIDEALQRAVFKPIGDLEEAREGFVNPFAITKTDELTLMVNRCVFFAVRCDKRSLPASAIEERLAARVAGIEKQSGRKIGRKERKELKEAIRAELLPQQLPSQALVRGYFDLDRAIVVLDTSSQKRADEIHAALRSNLFLGGIEIGMTTVQVKAVPNLRMTAWLQDQTCPEPFTVDDEGELSQGSDAVIAIRRSDMLAGEIRHLLSTGRVVTKLALTWADRVSLVLSESLGLTKLKWTSSFYARAADLGQSETADDTRAAELTILTGDVRELLHDVTEAFDGIANDEN
ncbi:recombination-associated protein RdgC [Chitinimonas sp.]|uniref:recombination-associated protein RdgC n=1 Tax=Chitinimonas sp. TaxID=1934313 RepID=UPI0035B4B0F6